MSKGNHYDSRRGSQHWTARNPEYRPNSGAAHHWSRLTPQQVARIKRLVKEGKADSLIAQQYGVSTSAVFSIRTGKTWRLTPTEPPPAP